MFLLKIYLPNHVDLGFFITAIILLLTLKKNEICFLKIESTLLGSKRVQITIHYLYRSPSPFLLLLNL